MLTIQATITVDERALSPARLVADLVRGFTVYRDAVYHLDARALSLEIETLTVRQASRRRAAAAPVVVDEIPDSRDAHEPRSLLDLTDEGAGL